MTHGCSSSAHTVCGRWFWPAAALGFACLFSLGAEPPPAEGEAQADKVGEVATGAKDKGKTGQGRGGSLPVTVTLNSVDDRFAPSVETLEIKYTITNGDARFAKIEIYKDGAPKDAIFTVTTIPKTEGQATYDWDGKDKDGNYVGPQDSPYTVRITAGGEADWAGASVAKGTTKVLVESMAIQTSVANPAAPNRVYMNDPANKVQAYVVVKLRKKDNTGALAGSPVWVDFSFTDPGDANTPKDDSYGYAPGKFLGKAGDAAAVYWEDSPAAVSDSADEYKLTCRGRTNLDQADWGKTIVRFLPSGVGGDDFKIKAAIKHNTRIDGAAQLPVELAAVESEVLEVWRRIVFSGVVEMDGVDHVTANSEEADIQPYFDDAYIEYKRGPVRDDIAPERSVKYVGLWNAGATQAPYQRAWATEAAQIVRNPRHVILYGDYKDTRYYNIVYPDQGPPACVRENNVPTEVVTARDEQEMLDLGSPVAEELRHSILMRAQAWVERLEKSYETDRGRFEVENGLTQDTTRYCMIGVKYFHPKFNSSAGESSTSIWGNGVKADTDGGARHEMDPDGFFGGEDLAFSNLLSGNIIIGLNPDGAADRYKRTIAHEIGHATGRLGEDLKPWIYRQAFGPGDHSSLPGLMDPEGSSIKFTDDEIEILRGIAP